MTPTELAKAWWALRDRIDDLAAQKTELEKERKVLEAQMVEAFTAEGLTSVKGEGFSVLLKERQSFKATDRDALREEMLTESPHLLTVNANTLQSICKQRIEEGKPLPQGVEAGEPWKQVAKGRK